MKLIKDMTESELRAFFTDMARAIEEKLPAGPSNKGKCLFVLLVSDRIEPGVGQYISNMQRASTVQLLRETADRLEKHQDTPR